MAFFKEASPARKALMGSGAALFAAGVVLLAVVAIGFSGGDEPTEVAVIDLTPTPSASPTPEITDESTPPPPTPVPTPPLGDRPYTMIIESIGVNHPVTTYGLDEQAVPEVPMGDDAANVVAWYDFSAKPGVGSNAVFAGHVTWFGSAVFFNLTEISQGAPIELVGEDGTRMVYKVNSVFQVDPADPNSLNVMRATPTDTLTIITCDGAYVETGDDVFGGEYSHRLVVQASLESITPPAAAAAGG